MQCLLENAPLITILNRTFHFFMIDIVTMCAFNPEGHQNIFQTTPEELLHQEITLLLIKQDCF